MRRRIALFSVGIVVLASLAGCAGSSEAGASCTYDASSSTAVDAITVTGHYGSAPTIDVPTPFKASTNENVIVSEGKGPKTVPGEFVTVDASFFDASTGKLLSGTAYDGKYAILPLNDSTEPAIAAALTCVPEGSRVLALLGNDAQLVQALQLPEGSTIIGVLDVHQTYLGKSDGVPQIVPDGFPMVTLATDGVPGITFVAGKAAPSGLEIATIKQGNGATVGATDTVVVHYSGWLWPTDGTAATTQFDSSWSKNAPASFSLAGGVIDGYAKALIGQKVGSQIEVIVPPSQGYGDRAQGNIPANSTLVFVVDILGIVN